MSDLTIYDLTMYDLTMYDLTILTTVGIEKAPTLV